MKVILTQPPGGNMGPSDSVLLQVNDERQTLHYGQIYDLTEPFVDALKQSHVGFVLVDASDPKAPEMKPPEPEPKDKEKEQEQEHDEKSHSARRGGSWSR